MSPVTDQVMEVEIIADTADEARMKAVEAGLQMVMVTGFIVMDDADTDRVTD